MFFLSTFSIWIWKIKHMAQRNFQVLFIHWNICTILSLFHLLSSVPGVWVVGDYSLDHCLLVFRHPGCVGVMVWVGTRLLPWQAIPASSSSWYWILHLGMSHHQEVQWSTGCLCRHLVNFSASSWVSAWHFHGSKHTRTDQSHPPWWSFSS